MKKIISFIMLMCIAIAGISAQTPSFLGIPVDGNIKEFGQKLIAKGYTLIDTADDADIYEGKFTDKDVVVSVSPGLDNNVAMVCICLPVKPTWNQALDEFRTYINIYNGNYGNPDIAEDENGGYTVGTEDFRKALNDTAKYRRIWIKGDILISLIVNIPVTEVSDGYQLVILYVNNKNYIDSEKYKDDI